MEEKTTAEGAGPSAADGNEQQDHAHDTDTNDTSSHNDDEWESSGFEGVNSDFACPFCGAIKRCSVSRDGGMCLCRNPSANRGEPDGGTLGIDAFWKHPRREWPSGGNWTGPTNANGPQARKADPARASARDLDRVYSALLAILRLTDEHRKDLSDRGYNDIGKPFFDPQAYIDYHRYRTMPEHAQRPSICKYLADDPKIGPKLLAKVPGFYQQADGMWTFAGGSGLLIPAKDVHGQVVALKVRSDIPTGDRYYYLSSRKHAGPSADMSVHLSLPIQYNGPHIWSEIWITEGEIKANVAAMLSRIPALAMPGVGSWEKVLPALAQLKNDEATPIKSVMVAFDDDSRRKFAVALALKKLVPRLQKDGYDVHLAIWSEIQPNGQVTKGIDDLLAAGLQPTVLTGEAVDEEVERILASAKAGQEEEAGQEEGEGDPEIISFGLGIDELDSIPDREDLIEGIWPARCLTAIIGPPSAGKTVVALDLVMSIITETPWHGQAVNTELCGDVVWIAGEQEENLKNLLRGWTAENPDRLPKHQIHIFRHAVPLRNASERAKLIAKIKKKIGNRKVVAIIADTLQANFGEGDVDNNNDMREFVVNGMADLRKSFDDALVCAPHHTGWDRNREKNASALRDNVLTMWHITVADEKAPAHVQVPIELRCSKPKGGEMNPRQFIIEKKRGVKETATGQQAWTYAVLRPLEANDVDHDQKWIGPFLRKGAQQTMDVIAAKYPKAMTRKEIEAATARATTTTREYLVDLITATAIEAVGENPDVSYRLTGNGRKWHPKTRLEWEFQRVTADLKAEGIQ